MAKTLMKLPVRPVAPTNEIRTVAFAKTPIGRELRTLRSHQQAAHQKRRISVEVTPVVARHAPTAGAMRWPTGCGPMVAKSHHPARLKEIEFGAPASPPRSAAYARRCPRRQFAALSPIRTGLPGIGCTNTKRQLNFWAWFAIIFYLIS